VCACARVSVRVCLRVYVIVKALELMDFQESAVIE